MRKCNDCNIICKDTDKLCPTCGMPTTAVEESTEAAVEPIQQKKKKLGMILGVCGALVALIALAALIVLPKLGKNDPMRRFIAAQSKFIQNEKLSLVSNLTVDSFMSGEFKLLPDKISTDAELKFDLSGVEGAAELSRLSLLLQLANDDDKNLFGAKLSYSNYPIISTVIYSSKDSLGIYIPELTDNRYELPMEFLGKLISDSAGASDATMEDKMPQTITMKFDKVDDLKASYEKLKKDYFEILYKCFAAEDFTQNANGVKLEHIDADIVSAQEITYKPNAERIATALKQLAERIKSDKALSDHLLSLMQHYIGENGMQLMIGILADSNELDLNGGERGLLPVFEKLADKLSNSAEDSAKKLVDSNFAWRIIIKADAVLAQYLTWDKGNFIIEEYGEKAYMDIKNDNKCLLNMTADIKQEGEEISGKATFSQNDNSQITELTISGFNPSVKSALGIPYHKYDCVIKDVETGLESKVVSEVAKGENGGTDHRISIDFSNNESYEEMPDKIELCLHTTDKDSTIAMPNAETVKVESLEQFESIVGELLANIGTIGGLFGLS